MPAPAGSEPSLHASDNSGLVQAGSAFSSTQISDLGRFAISVEGSGPDLLHSMQGSYIWEGVGESNIGGDRSSGKQLFSVNYEPFNIEVGMNMTNQCYDWIEDAIEGENRRVVGEVLAVDLDFGKLATR